MSNFFTPPAPEIETVDVVLDLNQAPSGVQQLFDNPQFHGIAHNLLQYAVMDFYWDKDVNPVSDDQISDMINDNIADGVLGGQYDPLYEHLKSDVRYSLQYFGLALKMLDDPLTMFIHQRGDALEKHWNGEEEYEERQKLVEAPGTYYEPTPGPWLSNTFHDGDRGKLKLSIAVVDSTDFDFGPGEFISTKAPSNVPHDSF